MPIITSEEHLNGEVVMHSSTELVFRKGLYIEEIVGMSYGTASFV